MASVVGRWVLRAALALVGAGAVGCDATGRPAPDSGADALGPDGSGAADADVASDAGDPSAPWPEGRYVTPEEVYRRFQAGEPEMLLLDVVDEEFYGLGCIEGSIVIPWDELAGRLGEVDRTRRVVVYCRLGVRSESALETLEANGYERVWIMSGGLAAWTELGYPTVPVP